jgi:hypothetical protein
MRTKTLEKKIPVRRPLGTVTPATADHCAVAAQCRCIA